MKKTDKLESFMRRKVLPLIIAVLLISVLFAGCTNNQTVRLGTGGEGGTYYSYGRELSELDDDIVLKTTAGSEANMRLLDKGFIDAAIVQSDSLDVNSGNICALTGLYTEAVQLIVRNESGINSVEALRGKTVSVGEEESGVVRNAKQILLTAGMTFEDVAVKYMSFDDSVKALKAGDIDAFFCTAGVPTQAVSEIIDMGVGRLIGFSEDMINRLLNLYPGYNACIIPSGTYKGQDSDIYTVGVRAVLVVRPNMKDSTAKRLIELVFDNSAKLNEHIATDGELTGESAILSVGIPFHPAAADYLATKGVTVAKWTGVSKKSVFGSQDE